MKIWLPIVFLFLGLFLLFFIGMAMPSGICFTLGIVMLIERQWPEKWGAEHK